MFSHFWTVLCMLQKKSKGLVGLFFQCSQFSLNHPRSKVLSPAKQDER